MSNATSFIHVRLIGTHNKECYDRLNLMATNNVFSALIIRKDFAATVEAPKKNRMKREAFLLLFF